MLFLYITVIIILYLLVEYIRFTKARSKTSIRIHVYGTRGKTSTTRCLYDALRHAGWTVLAKTTGDEPLLFLPDGKVQKIKRWGPARIQEYVTCIYKSSHYQCDALIFECMALAPESIVMARKIFDPTHIIITNTRPDHYECMGKTPKEIADTLALSINPAAITFALEDEQVSSIVDQVKRTKGVYYTVPYDPQLSPAVQTEKMVAQVTQFLGVNAPTESSSESWPQFVPCRVSPAGNFQFLNLFSANDVISSQLILDKALSQLKQDKTPSKTPSSLPSAYPVLALLATRPDRPLRTKAFLDWLEIESQFTHCICVGWHQFYAYSILYKRAGEIKIIRNSYPIPNPLDLLASVKKTMGDDIAIVGLGNMHGFGEVFMNAIKNEK